MGIVAITAIRVRKPGWLDLRFEDGTESPHGHYGTDYACLTQFAGNWSRAEWLVLQRAIRQPEEWHDTTTLAHERLREIGKICAAAARLAEMAEFGRNDPKQQLGKTDLVGFEESPMWEWIHNTYSDAEVRSIHTFMYAEYHKLPF